MTIPSWTDLLDFIAPRRCVVCGRRLSATERGLCVECAYSLPVTGYQESAEQNKMAEFFWGQMPVERVAALFYYHPHSPHGSIILEMKYNSNPSLCVAMGRMMAAAMAPHGFFSGIDVIVPVPITARRRRQRGYNQSELLARGVAEVTGLPVEAKAVRRRRFYSSQTKLGRWDRFRNTEGTFQADPRHALAGRHILIVDDVVTTGATVIACAKAMGGWPGVRFSVLSLGFTDG